MKREEIHENSLFEWEQSSFNGIIKAVTGIGKLSIFFKSLYLLRKKVNLQKEEVWFFRETLLGKETLETECIEFFKRTGLNPCEDFNIVFKTYQSRAKGNPFYECLDECDFPDLKYLEPIFNRNTSYRMGLTATMSANKLKLYKSYMNIVYNYTRKQAEEHNNINPLETHIIHHTLDKTIPYLKVWKKSIKESSEFDYYKSKIDYINWENAIPKIILFTRKILLPKMLFNLPSKIQKFNEIKHTIKGQCLVFATEHSFLSKLDIPHLNGTNDKELIEQFNNKEIQFLCATTKKIGRGINIDNVENVFLFSSGKSFTNLSQVIGRSRKKEGMITKLHIIVTEGTYEEMWIKEVNKEKDGFRTIESFNLNKVKNVI